jgi:hypothetical protein
MRILAHCKRLMENEPWHENLKKLIYDTPPKEIMAPWLVRTTQFPDSNQFPMVSTGRVLLFRNRKAQLSISAIFAPNPNALKEFSLIFEGGSLKLR